MTESKRAAVIYAAKSTEDKHGSIPTQIDDCQALAKREGLEVVAEYQDEAKSAFHGNRGNQLLRAREHAERAGAVIVVQHSDRLARGDGITADHLVELVLWARKTGVRWASVQDPQTFDGMGLVYAALMGDRNHDDSARKSAAVKSGLRRRADKGKPVGAMPLGYVVDKVVVDEDVITKRVVDPVTSRTVERIFEMVEKGATFGEVSRVLNRENVPGKRGGAWVSRGVRTVVLNEAYAGRKGYPPLIEPDRYDRIVAGLTRLDPAAVQRRRGGRTPVDDSFILRGTLFCLGCGAALYTRTQAVGRVYVCANRRQGTGLCNASPIPAELIEGHVLDHLEAFVGDAERWLLDRVRERDADRDQRAASVVRLRAELDKLERRRALVLADYEAAVSDGDSNARIVLEVVAKLDTEHEELTSQIADAEAIVSEWQDAGVDEALDYYAGIVDVVRGRIRQAEGAKPLNDALSQVVAGIWSSFKNGQLHAEFELRPDGKPADRKMGVHLLQHAQPVGIEARRITLPQTVRSTFV